MRANSILLLESAWLQLWQIAILVLMTACLVKIVGRRYPHLAYALWMVPLLKCFLPFVGLSSASVWSWLPTPPLPVEIQSAPIVAAAADDSSDNAAPKQSANPLVSKAADIPAGVEALTSTKQEHSSAASRAGESWRPADWMISLIPLLWAAGAILFAGIAWGRSRERSHLLSDLILSVDESLNRLVIDLEQRLKLRRAATIVLTRSNIGPAVCGLRHPEIYLPQKLVVGLSPPQCEAMLAHELVHIRRGDIWRGRLQFLAQTVWWFHPAVWWMNRQIDRHRERCCDEEVLASLDGDRVTYARCLVDVLTAKQTLRPLPWYPGARPVEITARRLEEIMTRKNMTHRRAPLWCWGIALLLAIVVLPGSQGTEASETTSTDENSTTTRNLALSEPSQLLKLAAEKTKKTDRKKSPLLLKYGDGKADGRKSLGGSGEMIRFSLPANVETIRGIKIHGSRYGYPKPPKEDFEITFVSEDFSEILHTETAPYSHFKRGKNKWVNVRFKQSVELPETFWVVLNFHAERTKGVYVSYDTSTKGEHSRIGLAGDDDPKQVSFNGDWMIQVMLPRPK